MNLNHLSKHLKEADIEDWLYEHPEEMPFDAFYRWIGRQVRVPSGIIDLLGAALEYRSGKYHIASRRIYVVEVKNVPVDSSALAQVMRYSHDIGAILDRIKGDIPGYQFNTLPVVIGPEIDDTTFLEAEAIGVDVVTFDIQMSLEVSGFLSWKESYLEKRNGKYDEISEADFLSEVYDDVQAYAREVNRETKEAFDDSKNGQPSEKQEADY